MELFFISFLVIGIAVLAMAVGVMVHGRAIQGSCGGLNAIEGLEASCHLCANEGRCRRKKTAAARRLTSDHRSES